MPTSRSRPSETRIPFPPARGVIFDMDGTLVDSGLDFNRLRHELGIPQGRPILEAIGEMPDDEAAACHKVLARHEDEAAEDVRPMPHLERFLNALSRLGVRQGVLTRNRRAIAQSTLKRLSLQFDPLLGREDAPAKPDPAGIRLICEYWGLSAEEVVVIGDYHFDLDAGRRAGARSVLYTAGRDVAELDWAQRADFVLTCYSRHEPFMEWFTGSR